MKAQRKQFEKHFQKKTHLSLANAGEEWYSLTQEGVREKSPKMPHKLNPRTLQIDGFRWDVLQKPLYPPFAHNRNKCLKNTPNMDQNSLKYHSGNGTNKKDNPKLIFVDFL